MKYSTTTILAAGLVCQFLTCHLTFAQSQSSQKKGLTNEVNKCECSAAGKSTESAAKSETRKSSAPTISTHLTGTLGPSGLAYDPVAGKIVAGKYPSIQFSISASPLTMPTQILENPSESELRRVANKGQDLKLLVADIELEPCDGDGNPLTIPAVSGGPTTTNGSKARLKIIGLLPNSTVAGTQDTLFGSAAKIAGAAGDTLLSLSPSSSFGPKVKATSGSLTVAFGELFPPRSIPNQFAYQMSDTRFGWFFQQNTRDPAADSILGMQTGLVLLEAGDKVKKIKVTYKLLSRWHKDINSTSKNYFWVKCCFYLTLSKEAKDPYKSIGNLNEYPALIPTAEAAKILQLSGPARRDPALEVDDVERENQQKEEDSAWAKSFENWHGKLAEKDKLKMHTGAFVLKVSLIKYLGLEKPIVYAPVAPPILGF